MTKMVNVDKKKKQPSANKQKKGKEKVLFSDYWTKTNTLLLIAGFIVLILGFFLMSFGPWDNPISLTVSPLILLVAYLVIFPITILYKRKN
jgi:membrane protein YdbS with pleckstrin-like domain